MKNASSRLKHRLALQQEVVAADGAGGFVRSWSEIAMLWAEIMPVMSGDARQNAASGREIFMAGQVQAIISHRILLRWRSNVTPAMRLVFDNRKFNIRYVAAMDGERDMLELLVQEGVAD